MQSDAATFAEAQKSSTAHLQQTNEEILDGLRGLLGFVNTDLLSTSSRTLRLSRHLLRSETRFR